MIDRHWLGVVAAASLACTAAQAQAADEVQQDRQGVLQSILDASETPPTQVASMRRGCAGGIQPDAIKKSRKIGMDAAPDAADYCAMALYRTARDGQLLPLYRETLVALTGSSADYDKLPAAIANSIMQYHSNQVPLGHGKAAAILPALAWDAGFTVAYQQRPALPNALPEVVALKPVAERCLGQQESNLSLCYSTGYLYGVRAVHDLPVTASR